MHVLISNKYEAWQAGCLARFNQLKSNEEELNRIFIELYGLQDELSPEVADKDVTVYRLIDEPDAEERKMRYVLSKKDAVVSLLSYMVGCMFGRYSPHTEGLLFAGGPWDEADIHARIQSGAGQAGKGGEYEVFYPDDDAILPLTDEDYFAEDDILAKLERFVQVVYGKETLEENLRFLAVSLNARGNSSKDILRSYFLNDFYKDHLKTYKKRPIYWLFDAGRQNSFKALVYLHRYDQDTLARLRTDYVHQQQERLRTQLALAQHTMNTGDPRQRREAAQRAEKLQKQVFELGKYEEILHHMADQRIPLDLDDGVKVNYAKMDKLVVPIK